MSAPLLPSHFLQHGLIEKFRGRIGEQTREAAGRRFGRWWRTCAERAGPATAVRTLAEVYAAPMFGILGFGLRDIRVDHVRGRAIAVASASRTNSVPVVVTGWSDDLERCWRDAVREGVAATTPWTFCWNARELRIVDAARPWGRRDIVFELDRCAADEAAFTSLWAVARAEALDRSPNGRTRWRTTVPGVVDRLSLLDQIVDAAAAETLAICAGLERGVTEALVLLSEAFASSGRGPVTPPEVLDQALTVVYRLLFLLFAEARTLVPVWHRIYRQSYSIEALREALERSPTAPGLWPAVQAISRLAHRGCRIGTLRVTPFNGHLFAPDRAPLAETAMVSDQVLGRVLSAVTKAGGDHGASRRIAFADLGVEQLGAIYERVLDHRLVVESTDGGSDAAAPARRANGRLSRESARKRSFRARLVGGRSDRKASATFYTPRPLCDLIVRRTLSPLVEHAKSTDILRLRVLDPAMGSGAFLVATCRYLARAYEGAVIREQGLRDHELNEWDRAGFRRLIARHCLYGVDCNPMAVQLARLSLWLATLAADVPLTFLDHHLRTGNSLVGATLADLLRQGPGRRRGRGGPPAETLPLLASTAALDDMQAVLPSREQLADVPDDTIEQVRHKERLLASLQARGSPLWRWRNAADLWCGAWYWPDAAAAPRGALYGELLSSALDRGRTLPSSKLEPIARTASAIAERERFFHWSFEFPEIFRAGHLGTTVDGFDAIVGNPPWDMVRGRETGGAGAARYVTSFVRDANVYMGARDAHVNLYLLFVERALQLLKDGGRLGMVVPWGLAGDQGAARVRTALLDRARLDSCMVMDNREGLFPIHRSLRLLVLTATRGPATDAVPLRYVRGDAATLDRCAERPCADAEATILISRELLETFSPGTLAVPAIRTRLHLRLLERLWRTAPSLAGGHGWQIRFGRELNATDDCDVFRSAPPGMPLLEGKHIEPFSVHLTEVNRFVSEEDARRRLPAAPFTRARVAYRDVASATNQRTLIAAVIPAGTITTHTLFCCRTTLDQGRQYALCALLNSFVANWMVRRWVSTHVTVALVERLPVPVPPPPMMNELALPAVRLARGSRGRTRTRDEARLQGLAARAWGVRREELLLILEDFPLVEDTLKDESVAAFESLDA